MVYCRFFDSARHLSFVFCCCFANFVALSPRGALIVRRPKMKEMPMLRFKSVGFLLLSAVFAFGCNTAANGTASTGATNTNNNNNTGTLKKIACSSGSTTVDCSAITVIKQNETAKSVLNKSTVEIAAGTMADLEHKDLIFDVSNAAGNLVAAPLVMEKMKMTYEPQSPEENAEERNVAFRVFAVDPAANDGKGAVIEDQEIEETTLFLRVVPDEVGGDNVVTVAKFAVRFKRFDDKDRKATLTFTLKNDVKLGGAEGSTFVINFVTKQGTPKINVDKNLQFPYVPPTQMAKLPIIVTNAGNAALKISTISFQVDAPFSLFQDKCDVPGIKEEKNGLLPSTIVILPGESHSFCVKFTPTDDKKKSGIAVFNTNDPSTPGTTVNINGNSDVPSIKLVPYPALNFGGIKSGLTENREVQIKNNGGVDLVIDSMVFTTGTTTDEFTLDFKKMISDPNNKCDKVDAKNGPSKANACTLPVNGTAKFDIVYSPADISPPSKPGDAKSDPVADVAVLEVSSNAYLKPQLTVQGIGVKDNCPVAVVSCKEGEEVIPQTLLHMIGSASKAPGGGVIKKYKWTVKQPIGSNQAFVPGDTFPNPTLLANTAGTYTFCLDVWDNNDVKSCISSCLDVVVVPDNAIHVELLWNTKADPDQNDSGPAAGADMDLHFAHPLASGLDIDCDGTGDPWFNNPFDAFWFNPTPQWGSSNPAIMDDPTLDLDDTDGAGPENLNVINPENNVAYSVGVHYWNDHGYGMSTATVSIFLQGVLVTKLQDVAMNPLDMWYVGKINWPNQLVGGPLPPLNICYESGDACIGVNDPGNPKGGKMWKASGTFCITPCYVNQVFIGTAGGAAPASCKKKP